MLTQREVSFIKLIGGMNGHIEGERAINIVKNITDVAVCENVVSNEELSIVKRILDFVDNVVDEITSKISLSFFSIFDLSFQIV